MSRPFIQYAVAMVVLTIAGFFAIDSMDWDAIRAKQALVLAEGHAEHMAPRIKKAKQECEQVGYVKTGEQFNFVVDYGCLDAEQYARYMETQ